MKTVVQSMKDVRAPFIGSTKSMADNYNGNGLIIFRFHFLVIVLLWVSSLYISSQRSLIIRILFPVFLLYLLLSLIDLIYLFLFPTILSIIAAVFIVMGIFAGTKEQKAY